jgi:hypothetical protein
MHRYPFLKLLHHIPNEGKRKPWVAKAIGIVAGMPDLCLPARCNRYNGLYMELKASGQRPTQEQRNVMELLRKAGYYVTWTDSLQMALDTLEDYCKGVEW